MLEKAKSMRKDVDDRLAKKRRVENETPAAEGAGGKEPAAAPEAASPAAAGAAEPGAGSQDAQLEQEAARISQAKFEAQRAAAAEIAKGKSMGKGKGGGILTGKGSAVSPPTEDDDKDI